MRLEFAAIPPTRPIFGVQLGVFEKEPHSIMAVFSCSLRQVRRLDASSHRHLQGKRAFNSGGWAALIRKATVEEVPSDAG